MKALDPMLLYELLCECGFTPASILELNALVDQMVKLISEKAGTKGMKMNKLMDLLHLYQDIPADKLREEMLKYRLFVKIEDSKFKRGKDQQLFQVNVGISVILSIRTPP